MFRLPEGIPNLPDLTHADELMQFGSHLFTAFLILILVVAGFGLVLAALGFALQRDRDPSDWTHKWLQRYDLLLDILQHGVVLLMAIAIGFFFCTTLANRYHHWEQAKVVESAQILTGERLEQPAPQVRYTIPETYTFNRYVEGEYIEVEEVREVNRYLSLEASEINVLLNQAINVQTNQPVYQVSFDAQYQVTNLLGEREDFFFEIQPPYGYTILQNFRVERDGERLEAINPGDYGFPFPLDSQETAQFRVTYQVQGSPRWVYNANGQLLSNFQLTAIANFPKADFASGIVPTQTSEEGQGKRFIWVFEDNVSVRNPFGVFTATNPVGRTGVLPRLLLLTPGLLLWWIGLLYLSLPLQLRDVAIACGVFFACIFALTYASRVINPELSWILLSCVLLPLAWGLGDNRRESAAALIATISGAVLPVLGLLVPYSGLTLSLAALLSVIWLAVHHWYGWYRIPPRA
ncbi:hypothetical protein [Roseofilum capinflatum]|uniref:Uncharacterized protein n=1 Tax=Roseofilum capinflatum BLCC-M114 TaxID=3022440 RepID=A0ABT7B479_9CYAN|nr:hypothetical protein [Roseofilum capinflatum]MDJ1173985.1 hypothetical protein [Roseofilum capinflatum BLCC-M114]